MKTNLAVLTLCLMGCGLAPVDESVTPALVVEQAQPVAPAPAPARPLPGELRTVLSDVTSPISLLLTEDTVFCSAIGYGLSFLKVSIPQLDQLAHFDHRVEEAGLPCAAVGACDEALGPLDAAAVDLAEFDEPCRDGFGRIDGRRNFGRGECCGCHRQVSAPCSHTIHPPSASAGPKGMRSPARKVPRPRQAA